jgi:hypothetical protein
VRPEAIDRVVEVILVWWEGIKEWSIVEVIVEVDGPCIGGRKSRIGALECCISDSFYFL